MLLAKLALSLAPSSILSRGRESRLDSKRIISTLFSSLAIIYLFIYFFPAFKSVTHDFCFVVGLLERLLVCESPACVVELEVAGAI